jgi:hypothetical protein
MVKHTQTGYIVMITMIVLAATGVLAATSLLWIGSGLSKSAVAVEQSYKAKQLANSCVELAMLVFVTDSSFTGSGYSNIGGGSCTYFVTAGNGSDRFINATGLVGNVTRKIQATVSVSPVTVLSWEEIP